MRYTLIFSVLLAVAQTAPLIKKSGEVIANSYIVLLKEGNAVDPFLAKFDSILRSPSSLGASLVVGFKYDIVPGFSVTANRAALNILLAAVEVELVEEETVISLEGISQSANNEIQQNPPSWGLSRISQRNLSLPADYTYNKAAGEGITVYIADTGVNRFHEDLKGRVREGISFVGDGDSTADFHGHGTHVAGIIGGTNFGVAKKVLIVPVKILGQYKRGGSSNTVAGLNWIYKNATRGKSVVNMSTGDSKSPITDRAVNKLYESNIPVIVAAGNGGLDACNGSPSGASGAYAVGNTDMNDTINPDSNFGACVSIFAPGTSIVSAKTAYTQGDNIPTDGNATDSGTSMSAPHVAGVAALYLSVKSFPTTKDLYDSLNASASIGKIKGKLRGAPNRLLYNGDV